MSEYKFTGPFYRDGEDAGYEYREESMMNHAVLEAETVRPEEEVDKAPEQPEEPEVNEIPEQPAEPEVNEIPEQPAEPEVNAIPKQPEEPMKKMYVPGGSAVPEGKQPQKPKKGSFGKSLLKAACIALVAGTVGGGVFFGIQLAGSRLFGVNETSETAVEIHKASEDQLDVETVKNSIDVSDVAEHGMPSVVSITNKGVQEIQSWFGTYQQETSGSGSGIIIGENDRELLIVTNYHVVADSKELSVYFSYDENNDQKNVVSAKIKGYDSQKDLAVIAVQLTDIPQEAKSKIAIATIGDSSQLKVGEQVVAIGNALGYGQSVTTGIVSALNRDVTVSGANGETITNKLIQTDAAINPGNSGGALLNMKGEIIGINSVKFASEEVEGMGYAIPISDVESIIGTLMNKETRDKVRPEESGYLGIECVDVTSDVAQMYDLPIGIYVKAVVPGSAAEIAGIEVGDVIVKLDGSTVASHTELKEALSYYKAGETVEITVKTRNSGYEEQIISVTLSSADNAGIR